MRRDGGSALQLHVLNDPMRRDGGSASQLHVLDQVLNEEPRGYRGSGYGMYLNWRRMFLVNTGGSHTGQ